METEWITRFSPRTRGCSAGRVPQVAYHLVFPAHAGMFPHVARLTIVAVRFPRARGDVPLCL